MKKLILSIVALILSSLTITSQTINDAGELFNKGAALIETNKAEAIDALQGCLNICKTLGEEGIELQNKTEQLLPALYFDLAVENFAENKFDEAITQFEKAKAAAKIAGDNSTIQKAVGNLTELYINKGLAEYNLENFTGAVSFYDKALQLSPNSTKAIYMKGLVFRKKGDDKNYRECVDKLIAIAVADDEYLAKAKNNAMSYFRTNGGKLLNSQKYAEGIKLLNTANTYEEDAQTYYYLSVGYNGLKNFKDALGAANKSKEMDANGKLTDKLTVQIEIAKKGLGGK